MDSLPAGLPAGVIMTMFVVAGIVVLERVDRRDRADPYRPPAERPKRMRMPRLLAAWSWAAVGLCLIVTAIAWTAFDETADGSDLAMRWVLLPVGLVGLGGLLGYYNRYVEVYEDRLVYRTWLRRVRTVRFEEVVAYRLTESQAGSAVTLWLRDGRKRAFSRSLFDLRVPLQSLRERGVEER